MHLKRAFEPFSLEAACGRSVPAVREALLEHVRGIRGDDQYEHAALPLCAVGDLEVRDVRRRANPRASLSLPALQGGRVPVRATRPVARACTAAAGSERLATAARSSTSSNHARSPDATRSRIAASSPTSSSRVATIASEFAAQTSGQIPGCPAATRVMSLKPPAASRNNAACLSAPASARFIRVAAVRCGTCETTATSVSCCSGESETTSAPSEPTT